MRRYIKPKGYMVRKSSAEITKKRMLVEFTGILVGACIGLVFGRLVTGHYFSFWFLYIGLLSGSSIAVLIGEKRKGLPTSDDLAKAIFEEQFSPLGLSAASTGRGATGEEATAQDRKSSD